MGTYEVTTDGGTYQVETEDPMSKTESFARGAANNFPLAPQAIAKGESLTGMGDEGGYSKNLNSWNQKANQAKQANPVTYGAGAVAGAAAPLAIPGVGEALEAYPVAGNAALGAANAISNKDLTKDPIATIKQAGTGAAIGGGLGLASEGISNALTPTADRLEANATANALDLGTFGVKKLSRGNKNPETAILDMNEKLKTLLPDTIGYTDTAASKFTKLKTAHDEAGKTLGSIVDSASSAGLKFPEVNDAIKELQGAASKYDNLTSARATDAKAELLDTVSKLKQLQKGGKLTFKGLADLKSDIGSAYHNPNLDNHGIDQAYGILSDKIDSILDRVTVGHPQIKPLFDKSKEVYRLTSQLLPAMRRGVSREVAGTGGGLTNAALGAGAIMGHPVGAALGFAGKTAVKLAAPDLAANSAYRAINAMRGSGVPAKIGQAGINELNDFLTQKYGNKTKGATE